MGNGATGLLDDHQQKRAGIEKLRGIGDKSPIVDGIIRRFVGRPERRQLLRRVHPPGQGEVDSLPVGNAIAE